MLKSKASLNRMDSASLETVDEESPIVDFEQPAYQILPPRAGLLARMTPRRTVAAATLATLCVAGLFATAAVVANSETEASFPWPSDKWSSEWIFGDYPAPAAGSDDLRSGFAERS